LIAFKLPLSPQQVLFIVFIGELFVCCSSCAVVFSQCGWWCHCVVGDGVQQQFRGGARDHENLTPHKNF
jgi:hypothetical protein